MLIRKAALVAAMTFAGFGNDLSHAEVSTNDSLAVLGVTLRLGALKTATFSHFSSYRVSCVSSSSLAPDCDSWILQSSAPPYIPYANLYFKGGRLEQVWKYWDRGYQGTDPAQFADTLHAALATLSEQKGEDVRVQATETNDGAVVRKTILISKGRRTVRIDSATGMRDPDGREISPFVNLSEILK